MSAGAGDGFRPVVDCVPVMIWRAGLDGAFDYVNAQWLRFTGRLLERELGRGWLDAVHPEDRARRAALFAEAVQAGRGFEAEYRLRRHDGAWRWVLDRGCPCEEQDGTVLGFVGSCTDVTERREAEDGRRRDVAEKEALLLEVHHRTRNTLQAVIGLLNLQGATISDPEARARFGETVQRVRALGLTQDTAYQTPDFARVELGPLVERLAAGLKLHHGRPDVAVEVDLGYLSLPLEPAVPMGLLLNELISHALRGASPGERAGLIRVSAEARPDGRLAVSISEAGAGASGAGRAADAAPQARPEGAGGLGLKLARILAAQLRAEIEVPAGSGGRCVVVLPAGPDEAAREPR